LALCALALSACVEGRESRKAAGYMDPLCAPDGSVVFGQYSNTQGSFETAEASRENCPWNKKDESAPE